MTQSFNVYCDESCHLENDGQKVMLFGCIWCPEDERARLSSELRDIKARHRATGELKWTKVSNSRLDFYLELVDWFMAESPLHFRALIVPDKSLLNHEVFNDGSHDTFYYKMYYSLLSKILSPDSCYNIYLDIKDTRSRLKVRQLKEVLCNNMYDFTGQMIRRIQNMHSHESDLMQLADFLMGAVSYRQRGLSGNSAKEAVIAHIEKKTGYPLLESTARTESKLNLFVIQLRRLVQP